MRRIARVLVTMAVGMAGLGFARPASADRGGLAWCGETSCGGSAHRTDEQKPASGGTSQRVECFYRTVEVPPGTEVYDDGGAPIVIDGSGQWWEKVCGSDGGALFGSTALVYAPQRSPEQLRQEAFEELAFPVPQLTTSPPADRLHLVNLRTWLSVAGDWGELSSTAAVPGVSVTVRAQPQRVVWDMGTGETVICDGPGTAYDASRSDAEQSTDCSYRWRRSSASEPDGVYRVTATVEWRVSWTVEGAPGGGGLPGITRSTTVQVRVGEGQARTGAER